MSPGRLPRRERISLTLVSRLIDLGRADPSEDLAALGADDPLLRDGFGRCFLLGDAAWRDAACTASEFDLRHLIRGVIVFSRVSGWAATVSSPVTPLYWEYVRRFRVKEPELTRWIADNRINAEEPFPGYSDARSLAEYKAMKEADDRMRSDRNSRNA